MKISVVKRNLYGRDLFFPSDDIGKDICYLMKRKTFNLDHISFLKVRLWDVEIISG
jgi:hypothetical protein